VHLEVSAGVATGVLAAFSLLLLLLLLLLSVTRIAVLAAAATRHGFQPKPFRETCNAAEYGSSEPPVYDFSKVTAPVVIFAGGHLSHMLLLSCIAVAPGHTFAALAIYACMGVTILPCRVCCRASK
jgi:hypothetical protein